MNRNRKVDILVQNSEHHIFIRVLHFKDSFSFLSASLDKLVKLNKYEGNDEVKDWENNFKDTQANSYIKAKTAVDLFTEKGVYPCDYMDTLEGFEETKLINGVSRDCSTKLVSLTKIT